MLGPLCFAQAAPSLLPQQCPYPSRTPLPHLNPAAPTPSTCLPPEELVQPTVHFPSLFLLTFSSFPPCNSGFLWKIQINNTHMPIIPIPERERLLTLWCKHFQTCKFLLDYGVHFLFNQTKIEDLAAPTSSFCLTSERLYSGFKKCLVTDTASMCQNC